MRKHLRYLILLLILLFVAINEAVNKMHSTDWDIPLVVEVFAGDGDGRPATYGYIDALDGSQVQTIEDFVNREARRYGIDIDAIEVVYRGRMDSLPPQPPSGRSLLENVWWSLKFRFWAARRDWNDDGPEADVELFVIYYDTATTQSLDHSVGLQGGLIGIINAFADESYVGSNQFVIAHELMHTLGATDKYAANNMPAHPGGYAEPYSQPLYPQRFAEIMGGRIPLSPQESQMPKSLDEVVVGVVTATEINWPVP